MSFTNETTHYAIPKPLGTDLTTPMDYNEAADAVDAALWSASQGATEAASVAAEAKTTADNAASAVNTLDGTVTTLSGTVATQGAAITALQNGVADVRQDLSDAIEAVKEPSATATYAHAVKDLFWYNDTLYRTTAPIAIGDTIVPDTNCTTTTVATELARIEAEIPAVVTPTASDVSFDPTGTTFPVTATDVDKALKAVAPKESVTYTTVSGDTYATALTALEALVDTDKLTSSSTLVIGTDVYAICRMRGDFNRTLVTASQTYLMTVYLTDHTAYLYGTTSGFVDETSSGLSAGLKCTLTY